MIAVFILFFSLSVLMSFLLSFYFSKIKSELVLKFFTKKNRVQDIHTKNILRVGGLIIFPVILLLMIFYPGFPLQGEWFSLILGGAILFFGGVLDDIFDLKPWEQFLFQIAAVLTFIILGNIKITSINLPFLNQIYFNDFFGFLTPFFLLIFFINIFNFLDGIDGIAAGTGLIAFLIIFVLSVLLPIKQMPPAVFSLIAGGALLGFLFFNKPPAKIFLGTSGSNLIGFFLGALSIIAGSKILTLLIVAILPAIDALAVILERFFNKKSIFNADKSHLHHILLQKGLSQEKIFVSYLILTAFFAFGALFLQNFLKLAFFILLAAVAFGYIYQLKSE